MAIERGDIHKFSYFHYGEAFYGSYRGMRYRIGIEPMENVFFLPQEEKEQHKLKAYAWAEPYGFAATEDKLSEEFPYSEEGVQAAVAWLNEQYLKIVRVIC